MDIIPFGETLQNILQTPAIKSTFNWFKDATPKHGWYQLYYMSSSTEYNEETSTMKYWNGSKTVNVVLDESKMDITTLIVESELINVHRESNLILMTLRTKSEDEGILILVEQLDNGSLEVHIK